MSGSSTSGARRPCSGSTACAARTARAIEGSIGLIGGVRTVRVSFATGSGRVLFDAFRVQDCQFERAVRVMGLDMVSCERLGASMSRGWALGTCASSSRWPYRVSSG
jgi:hypothetical protein